jgi:predicted CXXCH cytochrome family protein
LVDHQFNGINSQGQPGGVSLLCLSCHDGSVGVNEYGFYSASSKNAGPAKSMTGRALIGSGGDLSNHHPIGFNYDDVAALDQEIRLSTVTLPTGTGGVLPGGPVFISDLLATGGNMECVTCHDVHNTKNGGTKFTWVDDANSRFCFTCHVKDGSTQNQPGQ